jgi:arylformamidase
MPSRILYDISPTISARSAVFPGDTRLELRELMCQRTGDHLDLSTLVTTTHIGAHADAPKHYHPKGKSVETLSLEPYFGPCQVVHVHLKAGERIDVPHLRGKELQQKRILFRTDSFLDQEVWRSDFNSLSPQLIFALHKKGVQLVGLDTPSADPATSKALESHQALYECDMRILEGLELFRVPEGVYHLSALPLKIEGAEAAPVRAILATEYPHS